MTLREAHEGDLEFLQRLTQTPGWLANIGPRGTETMDGTRAYLYLRFLTPYQTHGCGMWVIELDGIAVGLSGIVVRSGIEFPDLGYALLPEFEGRGIATEAGHLVLKWAVESGRWPHLDAYTMPHNEASNNVLRRLGFEDLGVVHLDAFQGEPSQHWRKSLTS